MPTTNHGESKTGHILMDLPMPIYTPRLIIRPVRTGDAP
ncbi:MAG: hypothetical protein JWO78_1775 [Micavibrio sp.]|nr:hypothetical protein [Micavibrio sp.]